MKKIWKMVLSILLIFLIICIVGAVFMFDKNDYKKVNSTSIKPIEKLRGAQKNGNTISLTSEEVNNISSIIYKNKRQIGSIMLDTPEVFLDDDNVAVKVPVIYKNKEVIISSKGKVLLDKGDILYKAEYFKIGKMRIPKKVVLDKLNNFKGKGISISDDNIKIDKKKSPFTIKNLSVKGSVLNITMENPLKNILSKKGTNKKTELNTKDQKNKNLSVNKQQGRNIQNKNFNVQNNSARANALSSLAGQLANASGTAGSGKGQQIIGIMISAANNMMANPNYDYSGDAAAAKSIYSTLSAKEKQALKGVIYSNVDTSNVDKIQSTFGI